MSPQGNVLIIMSHLLDAGLQEVSQYLHQSSERRSVLRVLFPACPHDAIPVKSHQLIISVWVLLPALYSVFMCENSHLRGAVLRRTHPSPLLESVTKLLINVQPRVRRRSYRSQTLLYCMWLFTGQRGVGMCNVIKDLKSLCKGSYDSLFFPILTYIRVKQCHDKLGPSFK